MGQITKAMTKGFIESKIGKISNVIYNASIDALERDIQQCRIFGKEPVGSELIHKLHTNVDFFRKHEHLLQER